MNNGQDVVDSISTRTVTEERQRIVTKYTKSTFAIVGSVIGLLFAAAGVLFATGVISVGGIDEKYGMITIILGAAMFCFFGMNIRQKEFVTENYTVDRQVPIQTDPYAVKLREREEIIDGKINAMSSVFEKLAYLTSELEEKVLEQEKLRLTAQNEAKKNDELAQAAANAVVAAMREERRQSVEAEAAEHNRKAEELDRRRDEILRYRQELDNREEEIKKLSENKEKEYESRKAGLLEEANRLKEELAAFEAEKKKRNEELEEERKKQAEELERAMKELDERKQREEKELEDRKKQQAEELEQAVRELNDRKLKEEEELAEKKRLQREEEERISSEKAKIEAEKQAIKEAEEAKRAEEERLREEARLAEERRKEEEMRKALEAKKAEEARIAEEARLQKEKENERKRVYQEKLDNLGLSAVNFAWSSENKPDEEQ